MKSTTITSRFCRKRGIHRAEPKSFGKEVRRQSLQIQRTRPVHRRPPWSYVYDGLGCSYVCRRAPGVVERGAHRGCIAASRPPERRPPKNLTAGTKSPGGSSPLGGRDVGLVRRCLWTPPQTKWADELPTLGFFSR